MIPASDPQPPVEKAPHRSAAETELLAMINQGPDAATWQRYNPLVAKRRAETLTPDEQRVLIGLSDEIEEANARRMEHLVALAELRQVTLDELMHRLGIAAPV